MNKDLSLIIACAFIGLGILVVVVTQLGPPGSISQFQVPSPFLKICSTEECAEENRLNAMKPSDRISEVSYGEGWVQLEYEDGSNRLHSGLRNVIIQEYIDDPYYKHKKEKVDFEFGNELSGGWIEITYKDESTELISELSRDSMQKMLFLLNR